MHNPPRKPVTAAQEILLGAFDLAENQYDEFSEWDLTISTWKRNPNRFGCRGYEDEYPDHKRVMMEIMGTTKKDNPLRRGWLERIRPNTYRLTSLGKSEAERLAERGSTEGVTTRSPQAVYDAVSPFFKSMVFRKHTKNTDEPKLWMGAASFFQLTSSEPQHVTDRINSARNSIENAVLWMNENETDSIRRGVSGGAGEAISRVNLEQLLNFHDILTERFHHQIEAITS